MDNLPDMPSGRFEIVRLTCELNSPIGLKFTTTGNTLTDIHHPVLLEMMKFPTLSGRFSRVAMRPNVEAMQMMMKGKIRVKGDMQKLLKYAKFQQLGMKALQKVETTFLDE
jgi:hypothetical protein